MIRENTIKTDKKRRRNRRLRSYGLARTRAGYVFPGSNEKEINRGLIFNKLLQTNKKLKSPDDPTIKIHPLDPGGSARVSFNQRMVAPKKGTFLSPSLYDKIFEITVESLNDGTSITASFVKKKNRLLKSKMQSGDA